MCVCVPARARLYVCMYVHVFLCCMCIRYVIVNEELENQTQKPNNGVFNTAFEE